MMAAEADELLREDIGTVASAIVRDLRRTVADGAPWFAALLDAIARWPLPQEWVAGRYFRYLIFGEAFDWLLLAERLLLAIADLVPLDEQESLLFRARPPVEQTAEEFRAAIGDSKHHAHLNYLYGVVVEEALQLSVEEDLQKELRCGAWGHDRRIDEGVFQRIYAKSREELLGAFRTERGVASTASIHLLEAREFTYWLFKYRVRHSDGAKVASDTRRGLAQLSRMELQHHAAHRPPPPAECEDLIEGRAAEL